MLESFIETVRRNIQFGPEDAANLHEFGVDAAPFLPTIVDRFYDVLLEDPAAVEVFAASQTQMDRQRAVFLHWLTGLFSGGYDRAYFSDRSRIAASHVRTGVKQHNMVTGMEVVWQEFERRARTTNTPRVDEKLRSLHKLLSFELAVMLESYKERYSEQVRQNERSAVEAKLSRAEHLAEIGQLAASLAHEIKNPLAGISGAIQVMRDAMRPDDPHQPIVTEILAQIKRLDETVKDLLQYGRPTPPRRTRFSLGQVAARVLKMLHQEPTLKGTTLQSTGTSASAEVFADKGQIEQLIMNLILNAAHATAHGGEIKVAITFDDDRTRLVVQDTGKGMTTEVREQAFEPFFTTKARGTGLGLSICKRIVEAHDGSIRLESTVDAGTTVTIDLPRNADKAAPTGV